MSLIGKNIRKIRSVKKMSQAEFAKIFNLARPSVGAYEEGRAEPKVDTIIQIARHFGLSIDVMLTREITINELYKFDIFSQKIRSKPQELPIDTLKADRSKQVPLIKVASQLEYIANYKNRDYLLNLPGLELPDIDPQGKHAFEVSDNEMQYHQHGIKQGDWLLGNKIEIKKLGRLSLPCVVIIVTAEKIQVRRLISVHQNLKLMADSPFVESVELKPYEILEIWQAIAIFSQHLDEPVFLEEKVMQLESRLSLLEQSLKK